MPTWRADAPDDDRPDGLSRSSVEILLAGWVDAPQSPAGEAGRWQLALCSTEEAWALYQAHRPWLMAEAQRRGFRVPWAERHLPRQRPGR